MRHDRGGGLKEAAQCIHPAVTRLSLSRSCAVRGWRCSARPRPRRSGAFLHPSLSLSLSLSLWLFLPEPPAPLAQHSRAGCVLCSVYAAKLNEPRLRKVTHPVERSPRPGQRSRQRTLVHLSCALLYLYVCTCTMYTLPITLYSLC